jgi:hypothetical protein
MQAGATRSSASAILNIKFRQNAAIDPKVAFCRAPQGGFNFCRMEH